LWIIFYQVEKLVVFFGRRFKVCANLTATPQESLGVPRTLFKGFLAGSRAAPLVAAFLFVNFFFAPI
jgi:hypothetical protein